MEPTNKLRIKIPESNIKLEKFDITFRERKDKIPESNIKLEKFDITWRERKDTISTSEVIRKSKQPDPESYNCLSMIWKLFRK